MNISKDNIIESLNQIADLVKYNKELVSLMKQVIDTVGRTELLTDGDVSVDNEIFKIMKQMNNTMKGSAKKYPSLAKAFESSKKILLSINKLYYGLKGPDEYFIFREKFQQNMKNYQAYPINIYLITPDDVEHKMTIKYKSSDEKELEQVVARLAEHLGITDKSTILTHSYGDESDIITPKLGTLRNDSHDIYNIVDIIRETYGDTKITSGIKKEGHRLYTLSSLGVSPGDGNIFHDGPNLYFVKCNVFIGNHNGTVTNNINNVSNVNNSGTGNRAFIRQAMKNLAEKEEKEARAEYEASSGDEKQESEDEDEDPRIKTTKKWITDNEPRNTTRGVYYEKYNSYICKQKLKPFSSREFRKIMFTMGYIENRIKGSRIWSKEDAF
jgi:hypothetical protein